MDARSESIKRLTRAAQRARVRRPRITPPGAKRPPLGGAAAAPVTPDRPLDLTGGAAARLEFDD